MNKFKKGDIVGSCEFVGVVVNVKKDEITVKYEDCTVECFHDETIDIANRYDTELFIGALKDDNKMINANGDIVRWIPKVGEEYYQITCANESPLVKNIRLSKGIRNSGLDSLYQDCFSSEELALKSI